MENQDKPFRKLFDNDGQVYFDPAFNRIREKREEIANQRRLLVKKLQATYIERRKMPPNEQKTV